VTEVTPNLPHFGSFCKYCFMGTLLRYREAFYICKVMGYEDDLQIIRTEAEKYLNILF